MNRLPVWPLFVILALAPFVLYPTPRPVVEVIGETAIPPPIAQVQVLRSFTKVEQTGIASWYGQFYHGKTMANGKPFDMYAMTLACNTLPLGTRVTVVNLKTGARCNATVTDRGPFVRGRSFDVSWAVAKELGFVKDGLARISVEINTP